MKIGAILLCRFSSNRLPGKILKRINGKPILQLILERLKKVHGLDSITVATSTESSDDPIHEFCLKNDFDCYRGDLNDVSLRFINSALSRNLDYAARINGDNLFVDIPTFEKMITIALSSNSCFVSNVKDRTFPKGMSIEIVNIDYYHNVYQKFNSEFYKEHVTLYLYDHIDENAMKFVYNTEFPEMAGVQLAIDTIDDFKMAEKLFEFFIKDHTEYSLAHINTFLKRL